MSTGSRDFSKVLSAIRREFFHFASSYATAVKSGANVAGKHIMKAAEQVERPEDISAGHLITAFKSGVQHAGEQMAHSGIEFVERMKQNSKNNNSGKS